MQRVTCLILFLVAFNSLAAQDTHNFTQFFVNPYSFNPSYAGIEGRGALFVSYRKQWAGVEGSPSIANFSYHTPLKSGMSFGINAANDQRGLLSNSSILLSTSFSISIDETKFIRFGLSAGGAWNTVDLNKLQSLGNDPAISNLLNQSSSIVGNAGISFHVKSFHLGAAMPNLFSPSFVSTDAFTITEVRPFETLIIHASNRIYFSKDKFIFEPYLVYRINEGLPSQYEVAGVIHINNLVWTGGSLKQEFGISVFGGIRVNDSFSFGGSYTFKNMGTNELSFPTFEIHAGYLLGKPKSNVKSKSAKNVLPTYSFIDTKKKVKAPVKSPAQIAAEKKKLEEQKKEAARLAAEEANRKEEARIAKLEADRKSEELRLAEQEARRLEEEKKASNDSVPSHPNPEPIIERHETVTKGNHAEELDVANYVIAGVFSSKENAKKFAENLINNGFAAFYGHLTEKKVWYVHVFSNSDINETRAARDEYRKYKSLKDAWLLTVKE